MDTTMRLPLFPLGTVLFPQGLLPLQIFEVRYLHMIAQCRREGSMFGVVSLVKGTEVQKPGEPDTVREVLQPVGTLARITGFAQPMPALMHIRCTGEQRFRILNHEQLRNGLWMADVSVIAPDARMDIPEDLAPVAQKLGKLIQVLQSEGVPAAEMPIEPPFELEDCGWVANRWSEILPIPIGMKQDLLAQESPVLRLELVGDLLDRTELPF
jgi:Lon protease-like protein